MGLFLSGLSEFSIFILPLLMSTLPALFIQFLRIYAKRFWMLIYVFVAAALCLERGGWSLVGAIQEPYYVAQ